MFGLKIFSKNILTSRPEVFETNLLLGGEVLKIMREKYGN